jgi:predicted PurR-regulated permease PerM
MQAPQPPVVGQAPVRAASTQPQGGSPTTDLARTTLAVFFMVGVAAAALWVLSPFMPAIVWATMVVVALWPLMLRMQPLIRGRRWVAVLIMTVGLLLTFVIPLSAAVIVTVSHTDDIGTLALSLRDIRLPQAPGWVGDLPVIGPRISSAWSEAVSQGPAELARTLEPYFRAIAHWAVAQIGNVGLLLLQFLLTVVVSAILFARGENAAAGLIIFFRRLAGAHGENVVILAGQAIRSVALGVVLTAFIQSVLGGIGLAVAGVPFPGLLTVLMFVLSVAQIGPTPVLICAVIWMYSTSDSMLAATALLIWSMLVAALDNVLRPVLIRRGLDLPLPIVFAGVIGGLLTFGLVGIFLGPVVLAVVYTLLRAWVAEPQ